MKRYTAKAAIIALAVSQALSFSSFAARNNKAFSTQTQETGKEAKNDKAKNNKDKGSKTQETSDESKDVKVKNKKEKTPKTQETSDETKDVKVKNNKEKTPKTQETSDEAEDVKVQNKKEYRTETKEIRNENKDINAQIKELRAANKVIFQKYKEARKQNRKGAVTCSQEDWDRVEEIREQIKHFNQSIANPDMKAINKNLSDALEDEEYDDAVEILESKNVSREQALEKMKQLNALWKEIEELLE